MHITGLKSMLYNRWHREAVYSQAEYWDAKATTFSGHTAGMWYNSHLNQLYDSEQADLLKRRLGNVSGKYVMDLGCGTGRISRYLATRGATVLGVDYSGKAVEIARGLSPDGNPTYRVASMLDLDDSDMYDLALTWGSIAIACRTPDDLRGLLQRLYRAIKPGGAVFLLEPIHRGLLHRVLNMSQREFIDMMQATGFQVMEVGQLHFWPVRLLLAYIAWPAFVTVPCYHVGQWIMKTVFRDRAFGDYTSIYATVAK